jgi:hypothetical protein
VTFGTLGSSAWGRRYRYRPFEDGTFTESRCPIDRIDTMEQAGVVGRAARGSVLARAAGSDTTAPH